MYSEVSYTVKIINVDANDYAERAGIAAGDVLCAINGNKINDVLDYRFYLSEKTVIITCMRNSEYYDVIIKKGEYDDIGLQFETPLMDKKQTCKNKCIFCFIDQLPKGMRPSLYFKDDDRRLSFLHGNYITLTNMTDADIDRIIKMHISPIKVSVHTANPELRCFMMKNKRAGETLEYIGRLCRAGIKVDAQIVLCHGINDGEHLDFTLRWLGNFFPALQSISVVPAGLTKFRDGLYPLSGFGKDECLAVIKQVDDFGRDFAEKNGSRLVFAADEFYLGGGVDVPSDKYYEDYPQLENGVGMLRLFETEFSSEFKFADDYAADMKKPRRVSVATGEAAYGQISSMAKRLCGKFDGLEICVYKIINHFFGESITVSGLLTGVDIAEQLCGKPLGECLYIPPNSLRADGDLFLCGMTPEELSERLGCAVKPAPEDGGEWALEMLGLRDNILKS